MTVPCRQCSTPVDPSAPVCPVCGAANPGQRQGPPPGVGAPGLAAARVGPEQVVITGVDIPFGRMVMLILKVMIASIPAYIILAIIFFLFFAVIGAMIGLPALMSGGGLEGV